MDSTPAGVDAPNAWEIRGGVAPARVSLQYRFATALVAVAMVLLPMVYLGIIWLVAKWLFDYAMEGPGRTKGGLLSLLLIYLAPLAIGGIVILFMIKPLFSQRAKSTQRRALRPEDEPGLFAFIYAVCDLVKAPRPRQVLVDLEVNAAASLTHGVWSIFTRELTLVIGLPLAGGLSVRQFGGVLAHEFGHFAQGAGMSTTYIVRSVSGWFARVVYERDGWDATLEAWARESDWRLMIVLQLARFMVWIVRRILWALMMVGQFFSSVLMRQMEFDADHYEIQVSGSEAFISTAKRLRILGVGAQITHGKQEEAFVAKRLVDDLPGWMLHETAQIPVETRDRVFAAVAEQKTGWLDSHPSDVERITRAVRAQSVGVLTGDASASVLFNDFAALSREVTQSLYLEVLELPEKEFVIQSLAKMTEESSGIQRGGKAVQEIFYDLLGPHTMAFVTPRDLVQVSGEAVISPLNEKAPEAGETVEALAKELREGVERKREMQAIVSLMDATIPVDWAAHKLPANNASEVQAEGLRAEKRIQGAMKTASPFLERGRLRLISDLRWLLAQPETAPELATEVQLLALTLERIQAVVHTLSAMRPLAFSMGVILSNYQGASTPETAYRVLNSRSDRLSEFNEKLLADVRDAVFPFEHAKGKTRIGAYLVDGISHPETTVRTFLRADAILDRLDGIYGRALGRLAVIALETEQAREAATMRFPEQDKESPITVSPVSSGKG